MIDHNDPDFVIHVYGLAQAIEDGLLVPKFAHRWAELSGGKPIVATTALDRDVSEAGLIEIWNEFVTWRREVMPTLPMEDQMFSTTMNDRSVWVLEDGTAFTMMYPEDY